MNIYDYKVKAVAGNMVSMADYKGKILLIVNTAPKCGFAPQYEGLQALYEKYGKQGFELLDFPSNQFANQAPGSDQEIVNFCTNNYHTTFQTFSKIDVNGKNADPLYKYLKKKKGGLLSGAIKWNFTKFLIDKDGNVVKRFAPTVEPKSIEPYIEELLKK